MDNQNKLAKVNNTVGKNSLKTMVNDERTKKKFQEIA